MAAVIVNEGQCLADIALQYCGSMSYLMDICTANGLNPDTQLTPGASLEVPVVTSPVLNYLRKKGIVIACFTEINPQGPAPASGIGFWRIGEDFIVS